MRVDTRYFAPAYPKQCLGFFFEDERYRIQIQLVFKLSEQWSFVFSARVIFFDFNSGAKPVLCVCLYVIVFLAPAQSSRKYVYDGYLRLAI